MTAAAIGSGSGKVLFQQNGAWQDFPSGGLRVPKNHTLPLAAVEGQDSTFIWWDGALSGHAPQQSLSVGTSDKEVTARFEPDADVVSVTATVSGDGVGKVQYFQNKVWHDFPSGPLHVPRNSALSVSAAHGDGSAFVWWDGGIYGHQNPYEILSIAGDMTVNAVFAPSADIVQVNATTDGPGKVQYGLSGDHWVDFPSGPLYVPKNISLPLKAVPTGQDSVFVWWTGALSGQQAQQDMAVGESGGSVAAQFERSSNVVLVRATAVGNGSGKVQFQQNGISQDFPSGGLTVPIGSFLPLNAVQNDGSVFLWWAGDLSGHVAAQTLSVGAAKTVTARFEPEADVTTLTVTKTGDGIGTVTYLQDEKWHDFPSGPLYVPKSSSLGLLAVPGDESRFIRWQGAATPTQPQIDQAIGQAPVSLGVMFSKADVFTIKAQVSGDGKVQYRSDLSEDIWRDFPSEGVNVLPHESLMVQAVSTSGSVFVWWDGGIYGHQNSYTIADVVSDMTVKAVFVASGGTTQVNATADGPGKVQYGLSGDHWVDFPSSGTLTVPKNHALPLKASPSDGAVFVWWTGALSGQQARQDLAVGESGGSVAAQFASGSSVVLVRATTTGYGSGKVQFQQNGISQDFPSGGLYVPKSTILPVMAVAGDGSVFLWWTGALYGQDVQQNLQVGTENRIVTAQFEPSANVTALTVTKTGDGVGYVQYFQNNDWRDLPLPGTLKVLKGSSLGLLAVPGEESRFIRWQGAATPTQPQIDQAIGQDPVSIGVMFSKADVFTVKAKVSGDGKVQYEMNGDLYDFPSEGVNVNPHESLKVLAVAGDGAVFVWWDGGIYGHVNPYTIIDIVHDIEVRAVFSAETGVTTVTASTVGDGKVQYGLSGGHWVDFPSGSLTAPKDSPLPVRAVPQSGSEFVSWAGGGLSPTPAQQSLSVGSSPVAITATFSSDAVYSISLSATAGGYIEYYDGSGWILFPASGMQATSGSELSVRAVPSDSSHVFSLWTGDLTFLEPGLALTVTKDITAQAEFLERSSAAKLTASADGTGSGTVQLENGYDWRDVPAAGVWLALDSTASVRASATSGVFVWWTGDLDSLSAEETVPMTRDRDVTARFEPLSATHTLTASAAGGGTVMFQHGTWRPFPSSGRITVPAGEYMDVTAVDGAGTFVWWTGSIDAIDRDPSVFMDGDKSIVANFYETVYEVSVEKTGTGGGNVYVMHGSWHEFPSSGKMLVPAGDLELSVSVAHGSAFVWWTGDLSGSASPETLSVDGDKSVSAWIYKESDLTTVSASKAGSGSGAIYYKQLEADQSWLEFPSGALTVPKGHGLRLSAAPAAGSSFVSWSGGGLSPAVPEQTLSVGDSPAAVTATFSSGAVYNISLSATAGGYIEYHDGSGWIQFPASGMQATSGSELSVRAVPSDSSHVFSLWTGGLTFLEPGLALTVTKDITAQAEFLERGSAAKLTASADGTGSGTVQLENGEDWRDVPAGGVWLALDSTASVRASATSGVFVWWSGDLDSLSAEETVPMAGDRSIVAEFYLMADTVLVSASKTGEGSGSVMYQHGSWREFPASGELRAPKGASLGILASAGSDSEFIEWTNALSGQTAQQQLALDGDKEATARFEPSSNVATLSVTTSGGGSGEVMYFQNYGWRSLPASGDLKVVKGSQVTLGAFADGGSILLWWTGAIGGQESLPAAFAVSGDDYVDAEFELESKVIKVIAETSGNGTGRIEFHQNGAWQAFPSSGLFVKTGEDLRVDAIPDDGCEFVSWSGGGLSHSSPSSDQTMTAGASSVTITAEFTSDVVYTVSLSATAGGHIEYYDGSGWAAFPSAGMQVPSGTQMQVRAVDDGSHVFSLWTGDLTFLEPGLALTVTKSITAQAEFLDPSSAAKLTASAGGTGSGTVQLKNGEDWRDVPAAGVWLSLGFSAEVRAYASDGSVFVWWTGHLSGPQARQAVAMTENRSVTAEFYPSDRVVRVTASVDGAGSGKILFFQNDTWQDFPASGTLTVPKGFDLKMEASATVGVFVWWTKSLSGPDARQVLAVGDSDKEATALFEQESGVTTVTAAATGQGKVAFRQNDTWQDFPASGTLTVPKGFKLPVEAVAASDTFVWWVKDLSGPQPAQILSVGAGPAVIEAVFKPASDLATVTAIVDGPGKILFFQNDTWQDFPASGTLTVPKGFSLPVEAFSPSGVFLWWTEDLSGQDAAQTLAVGDSDKEIRAQFALASDVVEVAASVISGDGEVMFYQNKAWQAFPASGSIKALKNSTLSLTGHAGDGSVFLWWTGALSGQDVTQYLAVGTENKSVQAEFDLESNTVMASASTVGSGKVVFHQNNIWQDFPSSGLRVSKGFSFLVEAVAVGDSSFVSWSGDLSGPDARQALAVGSSPAAITATFTSDAIYTVSLSATAGGHIEYYDGSSWIPFPSSGLQVPSGTQMQVRAVDDGSHVFSLWTGGLTFLEPDLALTVTKNITAQAEFLDPSSAAKLTASASGSGSGTVQLKNGIDWRDVPAAGVWLALDSAASVRASATSGVFVWWTGDLDSLSVEETVPMAGDRDVTARFEPLSATRTVAASVDGSGYVQFLHGTWHAFPPSGTVRVPAGEPLQIKAVASAGVFSYWSGDATGYASDSVTLDMARDYAVAAHFTGVAYSSLTVRVAEGSGTVTARVGGTDVALIDGVALNLTKGSQVQLTPSASAGRFSYWSGDLAGNASPAAVSMDSGKSIDAYFTDGLNDRSLTVSVTGAGRVSVTVGSAEFGYSSVLWLSDGKGVSLHASATNQAYSFAGWSGDKTESSPTLSFAMDASISVTAVFETHMAPEHTIYAYTDGHADASPGTGSMVVQRGGSVTYAFTAREGWVLSAVTVDGVDIEMAADSEAYSYTFWNVSSNHTIGVRCAERTEAPGGDGEPGEGGDPGPGGDGDGNGGGEGGGGQPSSPGAPSPIFAAAVFLVLVTVLTAILWLFFAAAYNSIDVVIEADSREKISGKSKARRHKAYSFSVREGYVAFYRVGDGAWKKPASAEGGRLEVPAEDVERKLTLKAVLD
ncbi:MAG: hypothetical protein LBG62_05120 [Candidatus Methanoplasma sp.]|nr:hypothetical protein [Candidatus Methanoplasma sp.]